MRIFILASLLSVIAIVAGCNGMNNPPHPRYGVHAATHTSLLDISLVTGCSFEGVWARNNVMYWNHVTMEAYCVDTDQSFLCLADHEREPVIIDGRVIVWTCDPSEPNDAERAFREYQDAQE